LKRCQEQLGFSVDQRVTTGVATITIKDQTMNTNTNTSIPATQNEDWGFWGTMQDKAPAAWAIALPAIAEITGCATDAVRAFLDSRHGRHFADEVQNHLYLGKGLEQAVQAATQKWMGWSIGRHTAKDYGIPRGLPYLTGFVIHCEISEELLAA
jgi:hypothetical protein